MLFLMLAAYPMHSYLIRLNVNQCFWEGNILLQKPQQLLRY
ncbi:hypothetical protein APHWI1_0799 [Anaplasma phagocytophilum str. ApWI1]|uniref:Uncharacterized protein n=1 Tax=Anaplasma phagocytophilum str. ApWI1 TaxID=1359155 RepID=A0A0F3Q0H8_ANAPH|nr:hypothetical protein APHWI1_0799 [Anaplasma phagocytophilum str. ApWI1]